MYNIYSTVDGSIVRVLTSYHKGTLYESCDVHNLFIIFPIIYLFIYQFNKLEKFLYSW